MPCYCVEGQGRTALVGVDYLSVGHKSELYKSLESVAYSADKTIALFKQLGNAVFNRFISEKRRYKLARSVRLVSAGEASRNEYHLRTGQLICKFVNAAGNIVGAHVSDNHNLSVRARIKHDLSRIIFAVRSREYRYKDLGLCGSDRRSHSAFGVICKVFNCLAALIYITAVYALKLVLISGKQF